jgi:prepilin-type processing-associated H-X9-DG protein
MRIYIVDERDTVPFLGSDQVFLDGHVEFLFIKDIVAWDWINWTLGICSYALGGTGFPKA